MSTGRLEKLSAMLEKSPGDTFLLYAIALEHRKSGDPDKALQYLDQVIQHDWGYCYAYHQKGQILESRNDVEGARRAYQQGIDAARKKGDAHAQGEIEAALQSIQ